MATIRKYRELMSDPGLIPVGLGVHMSLLLLLRCNKCHSAPAGLTDVVQYFHSDDVNIQNYYASSQP